MAATELLRQRFGPELDVRVVPSGTPFTAAVVGFRPREGRRLPAENRTTDRRPFSGGDSVVFARAGSGCSTGFIVVSRRSGEDFVLSAGHCGLGPVQVTGSGARVGSVAARYFGTDSTSDFSTVGPTSGKAAVWCDRVPESGAGLSCAVTGPVDATDGSLETWDGAMAPGEVRAAVVISYDQCDEVEYEGGRLLEICHLAEATSNGQICVGGDSGGPVYVHHERGSDVSAAGTIVGCDSATVGWYQMISTELSQSDTWLRRS